MKRSDQWSAYSGQGVQTLKVFTSPSEKDAGAIRSRDLRVSAKQIRLGFTLIETLVAISVLLLSLAGPLAIASNALQSAHYARDEVTAYYLAQEGIEYVRAIRDQNYLSGSPWLTGLDESSAASCIDTPCIVDMTEFDHAECGAGCPPLQLSDIGELYNQSTGESSIYTRTLTITRVDGGDEEVVVTVSMTWVSKNLNRSFQLTEHLFNWL